MNDLCLGFDFILCNFVQLGDYFPKFKFFSRFPFFFPKWIVLNVMVFNIFLVCCTWKVLAVLSPVGWREAVADCHMTSVFSWKKKMVHHDMDFFGGLNVVVVVVVVLNGLIFSCNIWQILRTEIKKNGGNGSSGAPLVRPSTICSNVWVGLG